MKPSLLLRPLACAATLALLASVGRGDESINTIKFSTPSTPGLLKVVLARGEVHIHGENVADVVVKSEAQPQHRVRKDGLRVLTESATYALSEKDNVITLDAGGDGMLGAPSDFDIAVPRGTSISIVNSLGGEVSCSGVSGDIEIHSINSEVRLDDVVGGAVVDTKNGEIRATVRELHDGKALSFTSMNGEVVLRVPSTAKANIRLRTQNGTILTDFDNKALVTKVETVPGWHRGRGNYFSPEAREAIREAARAGAIAAQHAAAAIREAAEAAREGVDEDSDSGDQPATAPTPPTPPMIPSIPTVTGGKLVTGTLNGGGPEISVATMNGDVTLRRIDK